MGPNVKTVEQSTVSTPLAENILQVLQGEIDEGAFGLGAGPQQRRAGTAIDQFVQTLFARMEDPSRISAIEKGAEKRTNRQAADLREGFGAAGNRYGSVLANAEGLMRADALTGLNEAAFGAQQADTQALLQAITQMFSQGATNRDQDISTLLPIILAGILPPENIVTPGIGQQVLSGAMSGAAAYLGRG